MHYDPFKTLEQHLGQYDKRRIYLKWDLVTSTWPYKRDDEKWMLLKRCKHFFSVNERYDSQKIDGGSYYSIACLEAVLEIELLVQCETSPEHILYKNISKICFFNDVIQGEKSGTEHAVVPAQRAL